MNVKRIALMVTAVLAAVSLAAVAGWLASADNEAWAQPALPAPGNVQVVDSDNPREVVVSWDPVAGASGYAIHWMDHDAAWEAHYAGQDWRDLIVSVDVAGSATTTHTVTLSNRTVGMANYHFRVGSKSSADAEPERWSAWQPLSVQVGVNTNVQALVAALRISRHASELVALSGPTRFGMTPGDLSKSAAAVADHKADLDAQLEILSGIGFEERAGNIEKSVNDLVSNSELIQQGRGPLLRALVEGNMTRQRLTRITTLELVPAAETSVDDAFDHLMTSLPDGESAVVGELSGRDILRYTHVRNLLGNLGLSTTTLQAASNVEVPWLVGRIQELYATTAAPLERDVQFLSENGGLEFEELVRLSGQALAIARGDNNVFDLAEHRISLITDENALIARNRNILQRLLAEIDGLAAEVQGAPQPSSAPGAQAGEPGITGEAIRFGQSAALEGPAAALGLGMQLGIQAAFHEANQAGGINGRQLTLTTLNDRYEDIFAFASTQQLIERHRVFALIGAVGTPTTRAALPLAEHADVPFVGAFTGAQLLRGRSSDQRAQRAGLVPRRNREDGGTPGRGRRNQGRRALSERFLRPRRAGRRGKSAGYPRRDGPGDILVLPPQHNCGESGGVPHSTGGA